MTPVVRLVQTAAPYQEEVIEFLRSMLAAAERGEVLELVALTLNRGLTYTEYATRTEHMSDWIGRLEILKQDWIRAHLEATDG